MKNKTLSSQDLVIRFRRWQKTRSAAQLGAIALVSLSNVRASDEYAAQDNTHRARQVMAERSTDDSIIDEEIAGVVSRFADHDETQAHNGFAVGLYTLTPRERKQLSTEYTPKSKPVIVTSPDPDSEPLPPDFVPAPIADFESVIIHDPAIEEQARIEAAKEIAYLEMCAQAVAFDSEPFTGIPVDYSPDAGRKYVRAVPVAAPATVSADEGLRLAVLALS